MDENLKKLMQEAPLFNSFFLMKVSEDDKTGLCKIVISLALKYGMPINNIGMFVFDLIASMGEKIEKDQKKEPDPEQLLIDWLNKMNGGENNE